ncbi:fluoride efflux transporter CrcB [Salegentibacter sp. F14]
MFKQIILVFLGGGLGSALRFLLTKYLNNTHFNIQYGTFTVNILGSLLLGVFLGWAIKNNSLNSNINLALAVGFCGGFTTFSTFAFENHSLLKSGDYFHFLLYTLGSLILGILAIAAGLFLSKSI